MLNFSYASLWWVACWHLLVSEACVTCCIAMGVKNRPMQKQSWTLKDKGRVYQPRHLYKFVKIRQAKVAFKFKRGNGLGLENKALFGGVGIFLRNVLNRFFTQSKKYFWSSKKLCTLSALFYKKYAALARKGVKARVAQLHYTARSVWVQEQWAPFLKSRWYPKLVHDCTFISWHHVGVLIAKRCWLELALRLLRLRYRRGSLEHKRRFDTLNLFTTKAGVELLEHTPLAEMPFLWRMVWHLILRWEYWPARKRRAHTYKPEVEPVFSLSERIRDRDYNLTKWETLVISQYNVGKLEAMRLDFLILLYKYLVARFLFYFRLLGIKVFDFIFWVIDRVFLVYSILMLHLIWICVSFFYESRGMYYEYEKKLIDNQALTPKIKFFIYGMRLFLRVLYLFKAINTLLVCTCYFLCADIRWWPWWATASSKAFWWTRAMKFIVVLYFWLWNLALNLALKLIFFPIKLIHALVTVLIWGFSYVLMVLKITLNFFFKKKK
jgi:hypothetical protein